MTAELLETHFGFSESPFSLLPDPDILFWSPLHKRAYQVLEYGLMSRAPVTVLTGEVGAGKTTLLQKLLHSVGDDVTVGLISNAHANQGALMGWIAHALDIALPPSGDPIEIFKAFQEFVLNEYGEGRRVALIIDEAQNLGAEQLEELRMLTNMNSGKDGLLQLVLVGQPELRELLALPELRQFAQRVSVFYHLEPLDAEGVADYVRHRLKHVGGTGEEFTEGALEGVFKTSEGVPRLVNKMCELALVYAASDGLQVIDEGVIGEMLADGLMIESALPAEAGSIRFFRAQQFRQAAE